MSTVIYEVNIRDGKYHAEIRQDKEQKNVTVYITTDGKTIAKKDYSTINTAKQAIKRLDK